jgi:hypothetical protein
MRVPALPCAALASLAACTSVLGVADVALAPPDAAVDAAIACNVAPHFTNLPATTPASLIHFQDGTLTVPSLLLLLNTETKPDRLLIRLYDNMGQHGVLNARGDYQLTAADAALETCGLCAFIQVDYDTTAHTTAQTYWALGQGSLHLSKADATGLAGSISGLKFRHVEMTGGATRDASDGCATTIDAASFDLAYTP